MFNTAYYKQKYPQLAVYATTRETIPVAVDNLEVADFIRYCLVIDPIRRPSAE